MNKKHLMYFGLAMVAGYLLSAQLEMLPGTVQAFDTGAGAAV